MSAQEYKLVFAGSMGAGKTTAIAAISEIPPVTTEVANNDTLAHSKATTTAALDYGEVTLENGDKLRLYGTPGQDRFSFMWEILAQGALGIVILIDNSQPDPLADLRTYLTAFAKIVRNFRAVIGIGHTETHPRPSLDEHYAVAAGLDLPIPMFSVDVRKREDVLLLLNVLFHQIEAPVATSPAIEEARG